MSEQVGLPLKMKRGSQPHFLLQKKSSVLVDQQSVRDLIVAQDAEEEEIRARKQRQQDLKKASEANTMLMDNLSKVTRDYEDLYESFTSLSELYQEGERIATKSVVASTFAKHLLRSFLAQMKKQRLRSSLRRWQGHIYWLCQLERTKHIGDKGRKEVSLLSSFVSWIWSGQPK